MIRFIHTADLHLDSPLELLSDEKAKLRREEMRALPEKICTLARVKNADFIVIAGDIFDSTAPYRESITAFEKAMQNYEKPVFIVCGNHDYYTKNGLWDKLKLPQNVHIFRKNTPECVKIAGVNIYGASYISNVEAPDFADFSPEHEENCINLLLTHGDISRQMQDMNMDYIAMGHIHKPSALQKIGDTYIAYSGCCEGRGFDECGPRGLCLVELSGGHVESELIEIAERRTEIISLDVTGRDVTEAIKEQFSRLDAKNIYRIILTGQCSEAISQAKFAKISAQMGIFASVLRDKTTAVFSADADAHSLRGRLINIAHEKKATATTEAEREKIDRALMWALAATENGEEPWEIVR